MTLAQNYPTNYFRYPLDSLPHYVSPFGSLRDNHFHSGADLSTQQQEGKIVYAAADGFVSRIKVQSGGYGKALYIDHPNGYSTVYGHLQNYYGPIAKWIKNYQYKNQTFEFDKLFDKPILFVKKGDTIGISGNSGSSTGPHLHFEIRDSKTEEILNVAHFGITPFDSIKPFFESIYIYKFVTEGLVLKNTVHINQKKLIQKDSLLIYQDTLFLDEDLYGIGIVAWDKINNVKELKYPNSYALWLNQNKIFEFALNRFAFDKTKYINAHIDYPYYKLNGVRIQKAFISNGNQIPLYKTDKNKGKFYLYNNQIYNVLLAAADNSNNKTYLQLIIKATPKINDENKIKYQQSITNKKAWYPNKTNRILRKDFSLLLEPNSIYDTIFYDFKVLPKPKNGYSKAFQINYPYIPLHKSMEIAIKPSGVQPKYYKKLLLAYAYKETDNYRSAGGHYSDGFVRGNGSFFGTYFVTIDTIAPKLEQVFINKNNSKFDTLSWNFKVTDNLSGIDNYNGYLNGEWILLDFDAKNSLLTYNFDEVYYNLLNQNKENLANLKPEVKIIVTDRKDNKTEKTFIIKN